MACMLPNSKYAASCLGLVPARCLCGGRSHSTGPEDHAQCTAWPLSAEWLAAGLCLLRWLPCRSGRTLLRNRQAVQLVAKPHKAPDQRKPGSSTRAHRQVLQSVPSHGTVRTQVPAIQLIRSPLHHVCVHAVLHRQHLAYGGAIQTLQALKEGPAQALQQQHS